MHPLLADRRRLLAFLLTWIPAALLLALPLARMEGGSPGEAVLVTAPMTGVFAFICLAAWYPCRALPLHRTSVVRLLAAHASAALLSSMVWVLIGWQWAAIVAHADGLEFAGSRYARQIPLFATAGVLLFLLSVAGHYAYLSLEQAKRAEVRSLELSVLAREAQLHSLRAQVDPHFLFNCLNSIAALTTADPERARRMCQLLSDFFRLSLQAGALDQHSLDDEIALATSYLAVEQARFGRRLKVETWVERSAGQVSVPPLLLQPLVENTVRHGIAHLLDGGCVRISSTIQAGRLVVTLVNPCDPDRPRRARSRGGEGTGVGLENVRARLATAYGSEARLETRETPESFEAVLSLPIAAT